YSCLAPALPHSFLLPHLLLFFFIDPATTDIYTLSLHDALPISPALARRQPPALPLPVHRRPLVRPGPAEPQRHLREPGARGSARSEEHTSELQSHLNLVCRLLLEKKKKKKKNNKHIRKNRKHHKKNIYKSQKKIYKMRQQPQPQVAELKYLNE